MKQPIDLHVSSEMVNGSYTLIVYDRVNDLTIKKVISKEFNLLMNEEQKIEMMRQSIIYLIEQLLNEVNK